MLHLANLLSECVLLKIKNRGAYVHIQRHRMMALPSLSTINWYLRRLKPVYGFQSGTFEVMKKKAAQLSPMALERRYLKNTAANTNKDKNDEMYKNTLSKLCNSRVNFLFIGSILLSLAICCEQIQLE